MESIDNENNMNAGMENATEMTEAEHGEHVETDGKTKKKEVESPFVFRKGLELRLDNQNKELTQGGYYKLLKKKIISEKDLKVIRILYDLGVATRNTINTALGDDEDCKKNLAKLVKNNVVLKYHYSYSVGDYVNNTVYFYTLSGAAKKASVIGIRNSFSEGVNKLIRTSDNNFDDIVDMAPVKIFKKLELNNFNVNMLKDYSEKIEKQYKDYTFKNGDNTYKQHYMYAVSRKEAGEFISDMMIIPICARRNSGWRKELFSILCHITECMKKDFKNYSPVFIINTEDNAMACEAEEGKNGYPLLNTQAVFYISDWTVNNSPVLDNLIHVTDAKKENFDILSLAI